MVKSIHDLKLLIKNNMVLKAVQGEDLIIHRAANNILRIHGRLVSWDRLQDLIANGTYHLDGLQTKKGSGWGGVRVAGPGKKLGASKKDPMEKKKSVSLSMSANTENDLDDICSRTGLKRPDVIEMLIQEKVDNLG